MSVGQLRDQPAEDLLQVVDLARLKFGALTIDLRTASGRGRLEIPAHPEYRLPKAKGRRP